MRTTIAVLVLAMAACETGEGTAPWLTSPGFAGHAQYFPLVGTQHANIDCGSCHHASDPSFKVFDCVTCHDARPVTPDLIHAGIVAGYPTPPASADCLRCHPTGAVTMADHGRYFPIGAGTKHPLGCSQCHTNPLARSDLSKQQCNVCHVATDPMLATAHAKPVIADDYNSACGGNSATTCPQSCLLCHADGHVMLVANHPRMRIPHEGAKCLLQCHDAPLRTDLVASPVPPSTTPQPYAVNFADDPRSPAKVATRRGCYHCHPTAPPSGF